MENLINDLLQHSRVGLKRMCHEAMQPAYVFTEIVTNLGERLYHEHTGLTIFRVLLNLKFNRIFLNKIIYNPLKIEIIFHPKGLPFQVTGYWQAENEGCIINIIDNNIGIPAEHQEKKFNVFQRTQNQEGYPGTRIGLAKVNKISSAIGVEAFVWIRRLEEGIHLTSVCPRIKM